MKWFIAILFMIILSIIDIKKKEIPVILLFLFGMAAILYVMAAGEKEWLNIAFSLIPGAFLLALSLCTCESIGYGDGWAIVVLGLLLGLEECMVIVMGGLILSSLFSLVMLVLRKVNGKSRLPFLPFVTLGMGVVVIVQEFL